MADIRDGCCVVSILYSIYSICTCWVVHITSFIVYFQPKAAELPEFLIFFTTNLFLLTSNPFLNKFWLFSDISFDLIFPMQSSEFKKLLNFGKYSKKKNINKIPFFYVVFKEILPKFSDFLNSDDCIGKITSKSITLQPVFILKIDLKKENIFEEKLIFL